VARQIGLAATADSILGKLAQRNFEALIVQFLAAGFFAELLDAAVRPDNQELAAIGEEPPNTDAFSCRLLGR